MEILFCTLADLAQARGAVVVIDVLRAFTTAAFAFAAGAQRIVLAGTVEEALELRSDLSEEMGVPGAAWVIGEVGGRRPPGFDLGNSPARLQKVNLKGRVLVQRTSAGTQGVLGAFRDGAPLAVYAASFVVAGATARAVRALQPEAVTFVLTGITPEGHGDEDRACAEYLAGLLQAKGAPPDGQGYLARVRRSLNAQKFGDPADPDFAPEDIGCAADLDRFDFALRVEEQGGRLEMRPEHPASAKILRIANK